MNIRALIISLIGLCVASGSVWATMADRSIPHQDTEAMPQMVQLISARHDIQFGEEITMGMLAVQEWPSETVPQDGYTNLSQLIPAIDGTPRRAKETIRKGELLLNTNISEFGESVTMVQALGSNSRAVSIRVDAVTSVGGFVTPGDFVDVVLTEGRGDGLRAATILQDIRVLGVDENTTQGSRGSGPRTVTVEVAPREGQILALAQKAGTLSLTLRTERDVADAQLEQISLSDLLSTRSSNVIPSATSRPVEVKRTITVRRGVTVEVVEVE
ncbi:MAG: Flp pilus assembly protein CpaB [Sulfitobacter sp.]